MATLAAEASKPKPPFGHVKVLQFKQENVDVEARAVEGYASTPDVDREGEIILPQAFQATLPRYLQNPIVTWSHEWWEMPIGKTVRAEVRPEGLWVRIEFGRSARAEEVWQAVQDGLVRSLSVGFDGEYGRDWGYYDKDGVWVWTKVELYEIAVVPLPANPYATFQVAKGLGLPGPKRAGEHAKLAEGSHIGTPHTLPTAPEDARWNPGAVSEAQIIHTILQDWQKEDAEPNWDAAKKANVWWQDPGTRISDYKLKVARRDPIENDAPLKLFWRQVASRMAILMGARGGVDIPEEDRKACYDELVRCYERFDKQPPEFKGDWPENVKQVVFHNNELEILEEEETEENLRRARSALQSVANISRHWAKEGGAPSARVCDEAVQAASTIAVATADILKAGRVLSAANREAIERAIEALQEVLRRDDESRAAQEEAKIRILLPR